MGAVVMCARAAVRDLYPPQDGARIMSKGLTGLGALACISAPVGGLLEQYHGWRAALLAVAVFAAAALALVVLQFRETLVLKNPQALRPDALLKTWKNILSDPTSLAFSALSAASYGGLFTFLASAASAMNGFFMMAVAFGIGSWLGLRMDGTVLPLTNGLWFWSLLIALSAWVLVRRYGDQRLPAVVQA